ncbi:MOSC domain-containing protein [Luteococcus sanguinis]|uniref:MOSC domain-containing protein n=1 Tax=Luteococcus sanguinis TaxID=174038 RepID=A0ABW1X1W3_9ACTN
MGARVESLGWSPVKGTTWHQEHSLDLTIDGVPGDRLWSPITPDLTCVKATDVPQLAGVRVEVENLPSEGQALFDGAEQTIRYYDRTFPGLVFDGAVAQRLSEAAGRQLLLARTSASRGFIWSSPVSVLLRSELDGLPTDTGRYRPNVVIDDRDAPLLLAPGELVLVGEAVLQVERELDRCLVINHDPLTGRKDANLLKHLRTGALLGFGCRVVSPGRISVSDDCARVVGRAGLEPATQGL